MKAMNRSAVFALLVALLSSCASGLQLHPAPRLPAQPLAARAAPPVPRAALPRCQFGGPPDTEPKGLTRESEPENFFSTNMGAPCPLCASISPPHSIAPSQCASAYEACSSALVAVSS